MNLKLLRRIAVVLNSLVVLLSTGAFIFTFTAQDVIEQAAEDFVLERTVQYSDKGVDKLEIWLNELPELAFGYKDLVAKAQEMIATYRADPRAMVSELVAGGAGDFAGISNPKFVQFVADLRSYYQSIFDEVLLDLRIFSASNALFALLALTLIWKNAYKRPTSGAVLSVLMALAVIWQCFAYVDGLGFFSIIFKSHMGWAYPLILAVVLFDLMDYAKLTEGSKQ